MSTTRLFITTPYRRPTVLQRLAPNWSKTTGAPGEGGEENVGDELYQEAVRVVCEMGRASTSTLQRRLRIGYDRAARLIDIVEKDGGTKPRDALKKKDWMREFDASMQ